MCVASVVCVYSNSTESFLFGDWIALTRASICDGALSFSPCWGLPCLPTLCICDQPCGGRCCRHPWGHPAVYAANCRLPSVDVWRLSSGALGGRRSCCAATASGHTGGPVASPPAGRTWSHAASVWLSWWLDVERCSAGRQMMAVCSNTGDLLQVCVCLSTVS